MSSSREIKQSQKAKSKAQASNNLKEEANICNQLGESLSRTGDYEAAIREHQQESALSEVSNDVIGRAVANRKIGECYAEMGNIEAALKHQRCHSESARSVSDHAEEQRASATIGRTYSFRFESDQSKSSLKQAEVAFRKSLAVVEERLGGTVPEREISEMKARLFLNSGIVCDHLGEPNLCSEFIRRSVFIAEKSQSSEDLYRANFNSGNIYFRNGEPSNAVRCLEQAKECARKTKDKFSESECFHCIGKVQLSSGDFVAARRSSKKASLLGSQQPADKMAVKKAFKYADKGCRLEEESSEDQSNGHSSQAVQHSEQLGDLYCKVGCFSKASDAYSTQSKAAEASGKPARESAVIHVSSAATYTDSRQHSKAVEHYRKESASRRGNSKEECSTWSNIAAAQEESGCTPEDVESSYTSALSCAQASGQARSQKRASRSWSAARRRRGAANADETEARSHELCASEGWDPEGSDGEEDEEEEMDNSEPSDDSDVVSSDSDDDSEGYDKMVSGRRKIGRWNKRNEKGETSLHRACIDGNSKQVKFSSDQGHPVNPRDYCGWTPSHEACNHGHHDVVAVLLERGANINDPGGPSCEGVTPSHDALACGNFSVARSLVERGASVTIRNSKGETPMDTSHHWQRTYRRESDEETRSECSSTERLSKKAAAGGVPAAPAAAKPFDALQDSQSFDAENSEPSSATGGSFYTSQDRPRNGEASERKRAAASPRSRHKPRGTEGSVLYGMSSSSDDSDSDGPVSPSRPVRPRHAFPAAPGQKENPPTEEPLRPLDSCRESNREDPAPCVFQRDEYHSAIRSLGSAKTLRQAPSQPQFSSTPAVSSSNRSASVPEDEYSADDWLDDDSGEMQPKKKRRVRMEHSEPRREGTASSTARSQNHHMSSEPSCRGAVSSSSSRGLSQRKTGSPKPHQVKMTQMPGMVRLGTREVGRSASPSVTDDDDSRPETPPQMHFQPSAPIPASSPPPIRMRVRVQENVFLIPVPQSDADSCTVSWLCEQAAQRYYEKCGLSPRLSSQKEGASLSAQDSSLAVSHTNEEVSAEVCSWNLPPLPERYKKSCQSLAVDEDKRVTQSCEVQDGSSSVSVCGLSLGHASLNPLSRALKLQASLTESRLSGNRLPDNLLPESVATAVTMPRLRSLDVSANGFTGEGSEKAADASKGQSQPAFPCSEELDSSLNPLGDAVCESSSCSSSCCPSLSKLSSQACRLTARFLQQYRSSSASASTGLSHLKSVCLSHNASGSTGFELVSKTSPSQTLTHSDLSAVCRGPADFPTLEHLVKSSSQGECPLIHSSSAANGSTDNSVAVLARCSPLCPTSMCSNSSGNPSVTSAGSRSISMSMREASRPSTQLNLQGCQVSGPWSSEESDGLSESVQDLRLCSQGLNKSDRDSLKQSWDRRLPDGYAVNRNGRFLSSATSSS